MLRIYLALETDLISRGCCVKWGGHGYSLQWDTLNSKDYGVPQNRERVFIVCYLGNISGREIFPLRRTDGENPCKLHEITQGVADAQRIYDGGGLARTLKGESGGQGGKTGLYAVKEAYPAKIIKPYGSTGGVCGFKIAENKTGIASTCAARDYKGISRHNGNAVVCMSIKGQQLQEQVTVTPTIDTDCRNNLTRKQTCCAVLTPGREEKRQNGRRIKEPGEPSFTLTAQDRQGVAIFDKVCSVAYDEQNKNIRQDGTVGTLTCDGSSPKHNNRIIEYDGNIRIRRLTPRECWRLQGFPDEYFDKAKAAGISDTQLYKQAGNGVTVNVARAIGERLREIELTEGQKN
jgi:DNA (cytosine-5)-methyltransferase 1